MTRAEDEVPTEDWVRRGIDELRVATNDVERRGAIITWLRGVEASMEDCLDVQSFYGSPGGLIAAALEDLNNGITPSLLRAAKGGTRQRIELDRARARAVAGVEIVLEWQQLNGVARSVNKAIEAISSFCGLGMSSLRSLRSHVLAGTKYRSVSDLVEIEKTKMIEYIRQMELMGIDRAAALSIMLKADRTLLGTQ